jgi:Tyrosine phosphatase family
MASGVAATTMNPQSSSTSGQDEDQSCCVIKNFRPVVGTRRLYRCANPDRLAERIVAEGADGGGAGGVVSASLHPDEAMMLHDVGLVVDLRSESERDADNFRRWTSHAPGGQFRVVDRVSELAFSASTASAPRHVLLLDPLHPDLLMSYLESNWMTAGEKLRSLWYKLVDGQGLHNLRLDVLNRRGLLGLNQAVLETGGDCLMEALKAIVLHLEHTSTASPSVSPVVIHCVQGKDRTGMLSMLCQAVVGVDDGAIAEDYHRSESELSSGAAAAARAYPGRIDRRFFSGAPRQVMQDTLAWIRDRHGSVEGYLEDMGFDFSWRARLVAALVQNVPVRNDEESTSKL